jgi:hypothetical protein
MTSPSRTHRLALTGVSTALGLTLAAAPAQAERAGLDDPADASASLNDIYGVEASYGQKIGKVHVRVADLQPTTDGGPASVEIFIDTKPKRKGPEYRLATGLQEGTDFQVVEMKDWEPVGEPIACSHRVELDFDDDVLRTRFGKDCIGYPKKIRVGVRMTDLYDASHPVTDWLGKPRFFSVFLASG